MNTQARIRSIWRNNGHRNNGHRGGSFLRGVRGNVLIGGDTSDEHFTEGTTYYPGSDLTNISADFLGDWRSADSWQRFDMWRVRNRSRQLERGNPWCIGFKRNMLNNVLGFKGFHEEPNVLTSKLYGDTTDGAPDEVANEAIRQMRLDFGKKENFSTRQKMNRRDMDRLLLSRLIFDGEVILRKLRGFPGNDYKFSWQFIDPDYLDQNLNRVEPNGNIIKMGVELEKDFKYPVAYWFLKRRPNDYFWNYATLNQQRYYRVEANEVIHVFLCTEDDEQTRGWPWVFAAVISLFRLGKYQEAALINAAIGAARGVYFEKQYPEGFEGDPTTLAEDDKGQITLDLPSASALELPYGVTAKMVDMKYPDKEFGDFSNAMLLTTGAVFGTSYSTTTGDLSKANFVSSRLGQMEEREHYMAIQEFAIEHWKQPMAEEELYRAILAGKLKLPISKFTKFNQMEFTGRRWKFVQPVDDAKSKEILLNNCLTSISDVIRETTQEDPEDVFKRISKDNELMKKYGLTRIVSAKSEAVGTTEPGAESPDVPGTGDAPEVKPPTQPVN